MNFKHAFSNPARKWILWGIALLLIGGFISICLPHRTKFFREDSTLQSGKKMQVRLTLQSVWPWSLPERLIGMEVIIDGSTARVPKEFYGGLGPFDSTRKPAIDEWKGYPEIILYGKTGHSLNEVSWWFQNYSFSALLEEKNHQWTVVYHAEPSPQPEIKLARPVNKSGDVLIFADVLTVKSAVPEEHVQPKGKSK